MTDNDDPDNLGRVKAKVPRLLGDEEIGWALPAFIYGGASEQGLFAVPDVGARRVDRVRGRRSQLPDLDRHLVHRAARSRNRPQPGKKVLKTKSGHKIVLDDDGGTHRDHRQQRQQRHDGRQAIIKIAAGSATKIVIDAPQIELVDGATHPLVFGDSCCST